MIRRPRIAQGIRNVLAPVFWWLAGLRRPRAKRLQIAILRWRLRNNV